MDADAFAADVAELALRARARLGLGAETEALVAAVSSLHFEDLYLARLCEHGVEAAWAALLERYAPDLAGVLRRECGGAEAEAIATEVLADLSLPRRDGSSRTRIGRYDGSGPLWAWLATIGLRLLRRRRHRGRLEVQREGLEERASAPLHPAPEVADDVDAFVGALRRSWATLEPAERLAICWKFRDGLAQNVIARLLSVSEPTVSRLVARGIAKLRGAVAGRRRDGDAPDPALWTRLEKELSEHLERSGESPPPSVESP